jgi:hypothetical protein
MLSLDAIKYAGDLVGHNAIQRASDAYRARQTLINVLLKDRRIPQKG